MRVVASYGRGSLGANQVKGNLQSRLCNQSTIWTVFSGDTACKSFSLLHHPQALVRSGSMVELLLLVLYWYLSRS